MASRVQLVGWPACNCDWTLQHLGTNNEQNHSPSPLQIKKKNFKKLLLSEMGKRHAGLIFSLAEHKLYCKDIRSMRFACIFSYFFLPKPESPTQTILRKLVHKQHLPTWNNGITPPPTTLQKRVGQRWATGKGRTSQIVRGNCGIRRRCSGETTRDTSTLHTGCIFRASQLKSQNWISTEQWIRVKLVWTDESGIVVDEEELSVKEWKHNFQLVKVNVPVQFTWAEGHAVSSFCENKQWLNVIPS